MIEQNGSIPEKALQGLARDLLRGIFDMHEKLKKHHGNISMTDIILDENGRAKVNKFLKNYLILFIDWSKFSSNIAK